MIDDLSMARNVVVSFWTFPPADRSTLPALSTFQAYKLVLLRLCVYLLHIDQLLSLVMSYFVLTFTLIYRHQARIPMKRISFQNSADCESAF